jgi:hypothetical protein
VLAAPPRWLMAGVIAVVVLAAGWVGVPWLLRRLDFFRVRQIELVGVRYLAPDAVIGSLALAPGASVFDPTAWSGFPAWPAPTCSAGSRAHCGWWCGKSSLRRSCRARAD